MDEKVMKSFLKTLSYALKGEAASLPDGNAPREAKILVADAVNHQVLPLIVDGLLLRTGWKPYEGNAAGLPGSLMNLYRDEILRQAQKTADFLLLYEYLTDRGLHPLVMKGIICRSLYPEPEHRASVDEDLLVDPADYLKYHEALLAYGMKLVNPDEDLEEADEISYENRVSHLYIEVHKSLFRNDSEAYGVLNQCFEGALVRGITQYIYGVKFNTLEHTDHLLYLILHALKHFVHSGFGIRQVCDIVLFSEDNWDKVEWDRVRRHLTAAHALGFTAAVFKIGVRYLVHEGYLGYVLRSWELDEIDEAPLLFDIMEGGLYGASSMTRLHSSNMTLHAMARRKSGTGGGLFHTIFLPLSAMRNRYSYLKQAPILLPLAWTQRVFGYFSELQNGPDKNDNIVESIKIGKERIKLLEFYHILDGAS